METIYVMQNTPIVKGDQKITQTETIIKLQVNSDNIDHYVPFLVEITDDEFNSVLDDIKATQISRLWDSCNEYQQNKISPLGVFKLAQKSEPNTKAQAILQWVEDVWSEYKRRRDLITNDSFDFSEQMDTVDPDQSAEDVNIVDEITLYDFSDMGNLPYDFFDAMNES